METWINQLLNNPHPSPVMLMAVLLMGILSIFTCACNFAIIGMVAGYSGTSGTGQKTGLVVFKGLAFLAGSVLAMSLIGAVLGYAGDRISSSLGVYWKAAAGLVALVVGLYSVDLVPFRVPTIKLNATNTGQQAIPAILIGIAVGGLSVACNSCCNPFFPVILAASFVKGSVAWGFLMLLFFSLGFGIPLAIMVTGIGAGLVKISGSMERVVTYVRYGSGIAMILMGFYLLLTI